MPAAHDIVMYVPVRLIDSDAVSQDMHGKLQRTQAELREAQHQVLMLFFKCLTVQATQADVPCMLHEQPH